MSRVIVTLNINNYAPCLTSITYPYLKKYAEKCNAEFIEITTQLHPEIPCLNYDKFQVYDIAQQYDSTLFIDADALILPSCPDFMSLVSDDQVLLWSTDFSPERYKITPYMQRDGRWLGAGTWFVQCSRMTYDLWTPPEDFFAAVKNIIPTYYESQNVNHYIDDYQLTQNVARFGLKYMKVDDILSKSKNGNCWAYHDYRQTIEGKIEGAKKVLESYNLPWEF